MSTSGTQTKSFTKADIRKVVENFAADFSMMVQSTGLLTRDYVTKVVYDLNRFAESSYLVSVQIMLKDRNGTKLKAAVYKVSESAVGWVSERPGNNLWPRMPDGSLLVSGRLTPDWNNKTEAQKAAFVKAQGLNWPWAVSTVDVSLVGLTASQGQLYASSGYGWDRSNYS